MKLITSFALAAAAAGATGLIVQNNSNKKIDELNATHQQEINIMQDALDKSETYMNNYRLLLAQQSTDLDVRNAQLAEKEALLAEKEVLIEEKDVEINTLKAQLENSNGSEELEERIALLEAEKTTLQNECSVLENEIDEITYAKMALENQVALYKKIISGEATSVKATDLSGVVKIGDYAFAGCKNINLMELPSTVTTIGANAFLDCTFTEMTILSTTPPTLSHPNAISTNTKIIFIPFGTKSLYESSGNWITVGQRVTNPISFIELNEDGSKPEVYSITVNFSGATVQAVPTKYYKSGSVTLKLNIAGRNLISCIVNDGETNTSHNVESTASTTYLNITFNLEQETIIDILLSEEISGEDEWE